MTGYRTDNPADAPSYARRESGDGKPGRDTTIGELIGNVSEDVSRLVRHEVELAKAELRQEATKAGKAAKLLGTAGFSGYMVAVLVTAAAFFGLNYLMLTVWAALILAAVWAVVGVITYLSGRRQLRTMSPVPRQTVETLKEDAQWLKHPTG